MAMVKTKGQQCNGTEASWVSKDPLSEFLSCCVWKVTKDVPVRSKYGFPFQWAVRSANGSSKATGYARNLKQATKKAEAAREYMFRFGMVAYTAPEYLSEKLENLIAQ